MSKRIPRWLRWILIPVGLLLILYLLVYGLLTSGAVSRFALQKASDAVPALSFSRVEGSLAGGLVFDLSYSTPELAVMVEQGELELRLDCLWQAALCIRQLHLAGLEIQLSAEEAEEEASDAEPGEETTLPDIQLPVEVFLESLRIGNLAVTRGSDVVYQLEDLDAALGWRESTLDLEHLLARDSWCRWAMEGELTFINRYPLSANLGCESVGGFGEATAELSGDLRKVALELAARVESNLSPEPVPVHLSLSLEPLNPDLPARLQLTTPAPVVIEAGEQSLRLASSDVTAAGPLLSPAITAALTFESPHWNGLNNLQLRARASTEALEVDSVRLQLPDGEFTASGRLEYVDDLAWEANLDWEGVGLAQFSELLSGELQGQLSTRGGFSAGRLLAELTLPEVSGTVLERPFAATGALSYEEGNLAIRSLNLRQGDNRVDLTGEISTTGPLDVRLGIDAPQLAAFIPRDLGAELAGAASGDLRVFGDLDNPAVASNLQLREVRYGDVGVAQADLVLQWPGLDEGPGELDLRLDDLAAGGLVAANLRLQGQGGARDHALNLAIEGLHDHRDKQLQLQCSGGFYPGTADPWEQWRGQCEELQLQFAQPDSQVWALESPVRIDLRPGEPRLEASAFCLRSADASLCSEADIRFAGGALAPVQIIGQQLPWEWLQPFLPGEDLRIQGDWQLAFRGEDVLAAPRLEATITSTDLGLRLAEDSLAIRDLELGWQMDAGDHRATWRLESERSGASEGELSLRDQELVGRATITALQLADYAQLFVPPETTLRGVINSELAVSGQLEAPVLNGRFELQDGFFNNEVLPVPVEDIELLLQLADNQATATGQFRAADSDGQIGGDFRWGGQDWSGRLTVAAEPLALEPQPDMQVRVAPDLSFSFAPGQLTIAGELKVPEAQIEISELPESAVAVSSDAVIVGDQQAQEDGAPLAITVDLSVLLGDQVYFEGFGLETRITGSLRLQQQGSDMMRATGKIQLAEGRYDAYGQNLEIRSGDLVFVGDIDNPQLRVEAVRADTPEDTVVGLRASGPARDPQVALFSNPDMPQQAQLSYLLTGNPPGADVETDPSVAAAEAALSYALESDLGTGITRRAGAALGIEDLQVTAGATDAGTQIGLSGYITPNLLVRYGVGVFDAINTLTLRYQLTRSVYLEAISGESSDVGVMWSFERD
ncbi:translocation/assembly module TamB domain-containing protein [Gilvimarinus sp. F26214L]|uniref:translocation/assembly module TamB domain-containing protein n=1 Tax=Gilvimarinus sp. DZF01 TaxID=3461371 RepID=UPI004045C7B2